MDRSFEIIPSIRKSGGYIAQVSILVLVDRSFEQKPLRNSLNWCGHVSILVLLDSSFELKNCPFLGGNVWGWHVSILVLLDSSFEPNQIKVISGYPEAFQSLFYWIVLSNGWEYCYDSQIDYLFWFQSLFYWIVLSNALVLKIPVYGVFLFFWLYSHFKEIF